nr:hypothetical protein [uncultured Flavobacterium sp.]
MNQLITIILLFVNISVYSQKTDYDFKDAFNKDKVIIDQIDNQYIGDASQLTQFESFCNLHPKQILRETKENYTITKWKNNTGEVKQVTKVLLKIPYNDLIFKMNTYKFTLKNGTVYKYFSVDSQGLMQYSIGTKEYHISYVSIISGLDEKYYTMHERANALLDEK